jgi:hypothetical protein
MHANRADFGKSTTGRLNTSQEIGRSSNAPMKNSAQFYAKLWATRVIRYPAAHPETNPRFPAQCLQSNPCMASKSPRGIMFSTARFRPGKAKGADVRVMLKYSTGDSNADVRICPNRLKIFNVLLAMAASV